MNAGGAFGQIADVITRIQAIDRTGHPLTLDRSDIDYGYRHSGLNRYIITAVELDLPKADPAMLRERLKEVMAYKKSTQPLAEKSAGCIFRNPTLMRDLDEIGLAGQRISAGRLLDLAGCKGMRLGGAEISTSHANFFTTRPDARASDVIDLIEQAREKVAATFGIVLQPEVVIWSRGT